MQALQRVGVHAVALAHPAQPAEVQAVLLPGAHGTGRSSSGATRSSRVFIKVLVVYTAPAAVSVTTAAHSLRCQQPAAAESSAGLPGRACLQVGGHVLTRHALHIHQRQDALGHRILEALPKSCEQVAGQSGCCCTGCCTNDRPEPQCCSSTSPRCRRPSLLPHPPAQRTRWLSALMKRLCSSCVHTRRDLRPPPPAAPASLAGGSSSTPASPLGSGLALLLGAPPVASDAKPAGAAPGAGAGDAAAAGAGGAIAWNRGSGPSGGGPFRGWPSTAVAALTGGGSMGMPSTGGGAMGGGGASG